MGTRIATVALLLGALVVGLWKSGGRPGGERESESSVAVQPRSSANGVTLLAAPQAEPAVASDSLTRSTWMAREIPAREEDELASLVGAVLLEPGCLLSPNETLEDVALTWSDGDVRGHAFAGPDGSFVIEGLMAGASLSLEAHAAFGEASVDLASLRTGERRRVELVLARVTPDGGPWRRAIGTVLDELDQPVKGARFGAERVSAKGPKDITLASPRPESDENGVFCVERLPPELCRIYVWHSDVALGDAIELDLAEGDRDGLVLRVERGVDFEGEVVWPDGTSVQLFHGQFHDHSIRGENGKFLERGLLMQSGVLRLDAVRPGGIGSLTAEVTPGGGLRRYVLQETRTIPVRCVVVDGSGTPVKADVEAGFRLDHSWRDVAFGEPSSDGAVVVRVPPGEVSLTVDSERHHAQVRSLDVSEPTELRFVLEPAGMIRGHVLDPHGRPVAGARVGQSGTISEATTDDLGGFWFYSESSPARISAEGSGFACSGTLELDPYDERSASSVVLRLRDSCVLRGRVSGTITDDTEVFIDSGDFHLCAELEPDGTFSCAGIPPGEWRAFVNAQGVEGPSVSVACSPEVPAWVELRTP